MTKINIDDVTEEYLQSKCNYIFKNKYYCGCNKHNNYGDYCGKHKKKYLLDNSGIIVFDRLIDNHKIYTLTSLKKTIIYICKSPKWYDLKKIDSYFKDNINKSPLLYPKEDIFRFIKDLIDIIKEDNVIKDYKEQCKTIWIDKLKILTTIQRIARQKLKKLEDKYKGPAYKNINISCNQEDFFNMCSINEIEDIFFFSYKDINDRIWSFDIRTFKKLIDMKQDNPFNRDKIPPMAIINMKKRLKQLNKLEVNIDIGKKLSDNIEEYIGNRINDIIPHLSQFGYYINEGWIRSLSIGDLRILYSELEDIWNYRAQLSIHVKSNICPPNGVLFNETPNTILNMDNLNKLLKIILDDVYKLVFSGYSENDQKLGAMYFIIGLGKVSDECYNSTPWLAGV